MKRLLPFLLGLLCCAMPAVAEPAPAFRFGGRDFSPEEAARIAALPLDKERQLPASASLREQIVARRNFVGGIVLFSRAGIELSVRDTMLALGGELLLMPPAARAELARQLAERNMSREEFLVREAQDLRRQFSAAARQWYRKRFAGQDAISEMQIRDWYFRHQERFLVEKIDEDCCFLLPGREAVPGALSMMIQGASASDIRAVTHAMPLPADILSWMKSPSVTREIPAPGYTLLYDEKRTLLMLDGAVKRSYRKLDRELHDAIELALYDALARARLAAALETELKTAEFEFQD